MKTSWGKVIIFFSFFWMNLKNECASFELKNSSDLTGLVVDGASGACWAQIASRRVPSYPKDLQKTWKAMLLEESASKTSFQVNFKWIPCFFKENTWEIQWNSYKFTGKVHRCRAVFASCRGRGGVPLVARGQRRDGTAQLAPHFPFYVDFHRLRPQFSMILNRFWTVFEPS